MRKARAEKLSYSMQQLQGVSTENKRGKGRGGLRVAAEYSLFLDVGRCTVSPHGGWLRFHRPALRQADEALRPQGATATKGISLGQKQRNVFRARGEFSSPGTCRGGGQGTTSYGGFNAYELQGARDPPFHTTWAPPGACPAFLKKANQISKARHPSDSQAGVAQVTEEKEHGIQTVTVLFNNIQPL